ncbi:hypothetical protein COZ82_01560 [Candidatus Kaiserbacteria bacterium CG_4_8_14_3_um_filter_38_9]|uniref:Uncharacterized protein n=1 Tax=Candidatus Kaiserbacteria bacterium CG_4_8_14_3_um_filter_38_9 TaxID=1974599 RepID=A0A2M7IP38_9BACT|nr:MAG: hypothetical protein COZ82_01560 [Candidatus Kaiserbacteria bacterium CG_4_8_14_3_um_filter_38_9]
MKNFSKQHGFSLVEVLVAITLLLLIVTGPMKIITDANHSTAFASEQVTAFFLAQEGLELAQKGRDDLMLQYFNGQFNRGGINNPWEKFQRDFNKCIRKNCGLTIKNNGTGVDIKNCVNLANCRLYLDSSPSRSSYVHTNAGGNKLTLFTRTIQMFPAGNEIKVVSTVTWRTGSLIAGQKVELITYLENVYDTN